MGYHVTSDWSIIFLHLHMSPNTHPLTFGQKNSFGMTHGHFETPIPAKKMKFGPIYKPIKCDPNILMRATTFWPKGLMTSSWMSFPCINCNRSNLGYASVLPNHAVQKISPKSSSLEITQFGWRHFLTKYRQIYVKPVCVPRIYCIYLFLRAITSYHAPATSIEMHHSSPVQMTYHSVWWLCWWRYWQFCQAKRGKLPHSTDVRQPFIYIYTYLYMYIHV